MKKIKSFKQLKIGNVIKFEKEDGYEIGRVIKKQDSHVEVEILRETLLTNLDIENYNGIDGYDEGCIRHIKLLTKKEAFLELI